MVIRYVTINSEGDEVAQSKEIPGTRETGLEPARKLWSIYVRPTVIKATPDETKAHGQTSSCDAAADETGCMGGALDRWFVLYVALCQTRGPNEGSAIRES
jgi:hypothetical protein